MSEEKCVCVSKEKWKFRKWDAISHIESQTNHTNKNNNNHNNIILWKCFIANCLRCTFEKENSKQAKKERHESTHTTTPLNDLFIFLLSLSQPPKWCINAAAQINICRAHFVWNQSATKSIFVLKCRMRSMRTHFHLFHGSFPQNVSFTRVNIVHDVQYSFKRCHKHFQTHDAHANRSQSHTTNDFANRTNVRTHTNSNYEKKTPNQQLPTLGI